MPVFETTRRLVLASASPRRRELLAWLGLPFHVHPAPGESAPESGEEPSAYALRVALEKARAALDLPCLRKMAPAPLVLAADTVVVLNGKIYGKPKSHEQAWHFLRELAGNTHEVITGCCLLLPGLENGRSGTDTKAGRMLSENALRVSQVKEAPAGLPAGYHAVRFAPHSRVSMWACPDAALRAYAWSDEPMDKAGAYAVQGNGGFLISSIEGSWSNVVGLPMAELTEILLELGAIHARTP